ncbi:MAG: hypothetical protein MJ164_00565 [Alphaproteobacteria bacterium]|nr:hypothetical protein [Alphaproteobacteria bacterium]
MSLRANGVQLAQQRKAERVRRGNPVNNKVQHTACVLRHTAAGRYPVAHRATCVMMQNDASFAKCKTGFRTPAE